MTVKVNTEQRTGFHADEKRFKLYKSIQKKNSNENDTKENTIVIEKKIKPWRRKKALFFRRTLFQFTHEILRAKVIEHKRKVQNNDWKRKYKN